MPDATPITDVSIGGDSVRLGQFLKIAGVLDSGGDVKEAIISEPASAVPSDAPRFVIVF